MALLLAFVGVGWGQGAVSDREFEKRVAEADRVAADGGTRLRRRRAEVPAPKSAPADEDKRYSTSCRMDDYYAYGSVTNHSRRLSLSVEGDVRFLFYEADGDPNGEAEERVRERVSRGDTEEIEKHYYPRGTKTCSFEVSGAVRWEGEDEPSLSASCVLRAGKGEGYIHNGGPDAVRVSGRATWTFYDKDGDEIGDERERVSEHLRSGETELVGEVSAPSRASSCSLDISELEVG